MTKRFVDNDEALRHNAPPMAERPPKPTGAELNILHVLWAHGPRSVREVQQELNRMKPTGYTSVLKTMQIMLEKGLLDRDDSVRPQVYRARVSQERTQKQFLSEVVNQVYGGSFSALVMHAAGNHKLTPDDVAAIETLLNQLKKGRK
jgi:BlaI family penicillinase repressor